MRRSLSLSVSVLLAACSSVPSEQHSATPGGGTDGSAGATTGGAKGSATGGAKGSATGGTKGSATGGAKGSGGSSGSDTVGEGGSEAGSGIAGAPGGRADGGGGGGGADSNISFTTSFEQAESPLSDSARWQHNNVWFTKVVANGGNAYGTSPNPANQDKYEDSYAFLGGMGFPPDQYASGTVYKNGTTGGYLEIELQLRVSDSANSTRGYECFLHQGGAYLSVARWRGGALSAPATIGYFDILGHADNITPPKDGDLFEAQIVGTLITVKLAGSTILSVDVATFDGVVIAAGDPGIGFDAGASGAETPDSSYGFKDFSAKGL